MTAPELERQTSAGGQYRKLWDWDEVRWASHCIDCYPGNCPMRVYVKDGKVWKIAYFSAPAEVLEDPDEALRWGRLAVDAALRSPRSRK
mgnify:CR=1 FL=1